MGGLEASSCVGYTHPHGGPKPPLDVAPENWWSGPEKQVTAKGLTSEKELKPDQNSATARLPDQGPICLAKLVAPPAAGPASLLSLNDSSWAEAQMELESIMDAGDDFASIVHLVVTPSCCNKRLLNLILGATLKHLNICMRYSDDNPSSRSINERVPKSMSINSLL